MEEIQLKVDEFEAIRLADFLSMSQEDAAEKMGISRATFGRIHESGRKKIAECLVDGKELSIDGGVYIVNNKRTFECWDCRHRISVSHGEPRPSKCPECESVNIHRIPEERGMGQGRGQCGRGAAFGHGKTGRRMQGK